MTPALRAGVEAALESERAANTRLLNTLRFAGVSAFFALFVVLGVGMGLPAWQGNLGVFAVYFGVSGLAFIAARRNERWARLTPLSIAVLDVPVIFVLELQQFERSTSAGAVAGFNLGIYVLVILLAAMTLRLRWIALTAVVAMAFEGVLQYLAGISFGAIIVGEVGTYIQAFGLGYFVLPRLDEKSGLLDGNALMYGVVCHAVEFGAGHLDERGTQRGGGSHDLPDAIIRHGRAHHEHAGQRNSGTDCL